jgi:hypothetical protein
VHHVSVVASACFSQLLVAVHLMTKIIASKVVSSQMMNPSQQNHPPWDPLDLYHWIASTTTHHYMWP